MAALDRKRRIAVQLYRDQDADLELLAAKRIAVIGYGNQGRAQALNLRDSGLDVIVGNRDDAYAGRAGEDGFAVLAIDRAVATASVVILLIPDEVMPGVFEAEVRPHLGEGKALVFASGYTVAFGLIAPPPAVDVILVAPRMIGAGVRDLYVAGRGFPSFIGVAQDSTGGARALALALAKGIGSTRFGVVEVTFAQEAELDLFTEQCFGPAFGQVLTTAVDVLLGEGYPPQAVLLELYMSGELAYTLTKIAELGLVEQSALHSRTSQYGSMSRGMRFILPQLRTKMREGLAEIRSGQFAAEWAAEQAAGAPTLETLKAAARSLPLYQLERELRQALGEPPAFLPSPSPSQPAADQPRDAGHRAGASPEPPAPASQEPAGLGRILGRLRRKEGDMPATGPATPDPSELEKILDRFLVAASGDPALQAFSQDRDMTTLYLLRDYDLAFYMRFQQGEVTGGIGAPAVDPDVRLETEAAVLDGMFTGQINAMRAAMTGKLAFSGDTRLAISLQQIQDDLCRLYNQARKARD
jgi:ketol-acid reductoisomerase